MFYVLILSDISASHCPSKAAAKRSLHEAMTQLCFLVCSDVCNSPLTVYTLLGLGGIKSSSPGTVFIQTLRIFPLTLSHSCSLFLEAV